VVSPLKLFSLRPLAVLQHRRQPVPPDPSLPLFTEDHEGGLRAEFNGGVHAHQKVIIVLKSH
jgi:hypothetical protein